MLWVTLIIVAWCVMCHAKHYCKACHGHVERCGLVCLRSRLTMSTVLGTNSSTSFARHIVVYSARYKLEYRFRTAHCGLVSPVTRNIVVYSARYKLEYRFRTAHCGLVSPVTRNIVVYSGRHELEHRFRNAYSHHVPTALSKIGYPWMAPQDWTQRGLVKICEPPNAIWTGLSETPDLRDSLSECSKRNPGELYGEYGLLWSDCFT